nr:hypothetical protein [Mycolicibacterium sp. CBMA 226]
MKLGFAIPIVGPAITSASGLSAFCSGLEDLGYDTLWVGDRLVTPVEMHSTYPGKEQPYPPEMKRYLDPVLLGRRNGDHPDTAELQHAEHVLLRPGAPGPPVDHTRRAQRRPP